MLIRFPHAEVIAVTARTYAERVKGLVGARELADGYGMIFDMGAMGSWSMTMAGVFFPLDMIFMDDEPAVVGIVPSAPPNSRGPYGVQTSSRYVLEAPGGWAARYKVRVGDRVTFA
jgi:uncharacterized membrane protein (UPF0127 family)